MRIELDVYAIAPDSATSSNAGAAFLSIWIHLVNDKAPESRRLGTHHVGHVDILDGNAQAMTLADEARAADARPLSYISDGGGLTLWQTCLKAMDIVMGAKAMYGQMATKTSGPISVDAALYDATTLQRTIERETPELFAQACRETREAIAAEQAANEEA